VSARERIAGNVANYVDERTGAAAWMKKNLNKVFPDHWSFMLGEIALYSFVILLLSGTFLTFWFDPSMREVVYEGSYEPLKGLEMSAAYASALDISFEVRGGLLMRQIHHWSALIFMAAIVVHLLRVFFTGAFRKPREFNWIIGIGLLTLGIVEGFLGYSLPDDLLSGTGIRIAEAILQAIPLVGSYLSYFLFGGVFPGEAFIPRIYTIHILLLPGIFLALITVHLMLVWYQKHTQYPGPGRTEKNVVGYPLLPIYMAKAGGFFFIVFGVTALLGAVASINPIWLYGPYTPGQISAGSQPDWYMGWLDGLVRMAPPIELMIFGYTLSLNILILYFLLARSSASSVSSLYYLVPAVTAVEAYFLFGETSSMVAMTLSLPTLTSRLIRSCGLVELESLFCLQSHLSLPRDSVSRYNVLIVSLFYMDAKPVALS